MKSHVFICLCVVLIIEGCNSRGSNYTRKEINNGDISLTWSVKLTMDGGNSEFVEVSKNGATKQIITTYDDVITNIALDKRIITVKVFEPGRNGVYAKEIPKEEFGYKVVLDSMVTYKEWYHRYDSTRDL